MLDTQYRMHPDICEFPSLQFYNGNIKTGEGVLTQTTKKWHKDQASHAAFLCLQTHCQPRPPMLGSRQGCPVDQKLCYWRRSQAGYTMKLHKHDHPCDGGTSRHMERAGQGMPRQVMLDAKPGHAAPCNR